MRVIEIKGISFSNKGAELMLIAVQEQFQARGIAARFVVEPNDDFEQRMRYGVWQKSRHIYKRVNILAPVAMLPRKVRDLLGVVNADEIDCVFDASGFSYGDFWRAKVAWDRLGKPIQKLRKAGIPVIVLPQALGPFETADSAAAFGQVLRHANLVFARDDESLRHAQSLSKTATNLFQAPDFTCLVEAQPMTAVTPPQNAVCFITNEKMAGTEAQQQSYLSWMTGLVNTVRTAGVPVYFVNHGGAADASIAAQIIAATDPEIPLLEAENAKQTKWLIAQARVVVGSRFHALVSALSQGIPILATSWSHKYQALLADYKCSERLYDCTDVEDARAALQQLLENADLYADEQQRLLACADTQKQLTKAMWQRVFESLQGKL